MIQRSILKNSLKALAFFVVFGSSAFQMQTNAQINGITPEDAIKTQNVTSGKISADGKKIAYTVTQPADPYKDNEAAGSHLYVYDVDGKTSTPYVTSTTARGINFRPGKESITYLSYSKDHNKTVLYEISLKGGASTVLYEFQRSISSYSWNPDGERIAFTSMDKAEESKSKLPYQATVFEENQPNRKGYIVNVNSNSLPVTIKAEGSVYMTEWSPNGNQLAITASPTSSIDDFYMGQAVKIVNPTSGNVVAEVDNKGKIGQIAWSPDARQIALRVGADINDPIDGRILIVNATGGTPSIIDKDFKGKYEQIEWTDKGIFFMASRGTSSLIGSIQADGSKKNILFESETHAMRDMSFSNKIISFIASTPQHPNELFIAKNAKRPQVERVTFHNDWLKNKSLGKLEVITYTARDGKFDVQGILIYPVNYQEGARVPLITMVHGGPESHYKNGWMTGYSMPGQMAAAEGYAVFYPNYRGSTGRGMEFTYSSQADLSGKEFDDIVDGVDYLIARGIADKDKIGVTGGSYGGYASAWMSTYYSDRFAAAVMFVGISNNLSKWGTSDIPNELYYVHSRERLWESDAMWMNYLKRSPIYHVEKSQTPILIMHGENDTRVHPAQSLELYRHLKVRKPEVPVRLVFYPGEGHGNRRASSQLDYAFRMMQWFDTYLKTGNRTAEMPGWDVPMPKK